MFAALSVHGAHLKINGKMPSTFGLEKGYTLPNLSQHINHKLTLDFQSKVPYGV